MLQKCPINETYQLSLDLYSTNLQEFSWQSHYRGLFSFQLPID